MHASNTPNYQPLQMTTTDIDYSKSTLVLRAASRLAAAAHIKENSTL